MQQKMTQPGAPTKKQPPEEKHDDDDPFQRFLKETMTMLG
jgi:hypothetical protein